MLKGKAHDGQRIWFMDYARAWLVGIVVIFHSALSQTTYLPAWAVVDSRHTKLADYLSSWLDVFQMPLLFFIAGYFAWPSLQSKGPRGFLRGKVLRLLVPGIPVLLLCNPIYGYVFHLARSFEAGVPRMSFWQYWPEFFRSARWFERGNLLEFRFSLMHLWFVTLLFCFCVAVAVVTSLTRRIDSPAAEQPRAVPSLPSILVTLVGMTVVAWVATVLILLVAASFEWIMLGSCLLFQVPNVAYYACYFSLGIHASRKGWFARPNALGPTWAWFALCAGLSWPFLVVDNWITEDMTLATSYRFMVAYWCLRGFVCLAAFGALFTFALRHCNRPSPVQRHFAGHSYRMYLVHLSIVVLLQYAFLHVTWLSPLALFFGSAAASLAASYGFALVLGATYDRLMRVGTRCDPASTSS